MPDTKLVRALHIPAAVLALDITWSARLVLAEVMDLHQVNGNVFALDDHFVERCRIKKRTVGGAIKELEDAGLLHRDTNQSARHKRILTPLIGADGRPRPIVESAIGLLPNLPQPIAESATDLLQNLQEPIADSADINTNYSFKGNTNESAPPKKMGEGDVEAALAPTENQKIVTAPNPVAPAPSPADDDVEVVLPPDDPAEARAFVPELAKCWHVSQQHNNQGWRKLTAFVLAVATQGRLAYLRHQFAGFNAYFSDGLTPHNLDKFCGQDGQSPPYSLGTWCSHGDWAAKAKDRRRPAAGTQPAPPARASASPSTQKNDWR